MPGKWQTDESSLIARQCYAGSPSILLRSLDGIHLATAMLAGCHRILSTDKRMNAAAALLLQSGDKPG